jgi:F-type H+-transporting ATPase subunit gamma
MATLEQLRKRLESTEQLQTVVKTMKSIAAVRIRQFEKAAEALLEYQRIVEMGFQILASGIPGGLAPVAGEDRNSRVAAVVFGSDQGMCGPFNEQIAAHAAGRLHPAGKGGEALVLAVGARVSASLQREGIHVQAEHPVPASTDGFAALVQDVLLRIESWRFEGGAGRCTLFHNVPLAGSSFRPHTLRILPLEEAWLADLEKRPWGSNSLPTFTLEPDRLFSALLRQHLFVSIYRALAASLAAENASRIASMQAAEKNIEERLARLEAAFRQERQRSITEELLDIVAGFEVLRPSESEAEGGSIP